MGDPPVAMLRWRCRRGMRELDLLLLRFLEQDYPSAQAAERAAFVGLLSRPDPDIFALLAGRLRTDDPALAHVVQRLLSTG